jgi:hypothetical protein
MTSMCNLEHPGNRAFGFLVDTPGIRALVNETTRLTASIADTVTRVEALKPAFSTLLAADGWLPEEYASPDFTSGMGSGIGQYALYRAEDGSLTLFSLVIPAGAETPVHDHLAWGLIGVYRGRQHEPCSRSRARTCWRLASSIPSFRRATTFITSGPSRTYRRSRFTCSPTTPRACGDIGSSQPPVR